MNVVTIIFIAIAISVVVVAVFNWKCLLDCTANNWVRADGAEYFTKSSKFGNINKMVLIGPRGEIVLQPVGDIDSTINDVGDGIKAYADGAFIFYTAALHVAQAARDELKQADELLKEKINANETNIEQIVGSAVQKGAPYSIKMGEGHKGVRGDRYLIGAGGGSRVLYDHDKTDAKFLFV